eukprot:488065_1
MESSINNLAFKLFIKREYGSWKSIHKHLPLKSQIIGLMKREWNDMDISDNCKTYYIQEATKQLSKTRTKSRRRKRGKNKSNIHNEADTNKNIKNKYVNQPPTKKQKISPQKVSPHVQKLSPQTVSPQVTNQSVIFAVPTKTLSSTTRSVSTSPNVTNNINICNILQTHKRYVMKKYSESIEPWDYVRKVTGFNDNVFSVVVDFTVGTGFTIDEKYLNNRVALNDEKNEITFGFPEYSTPNWNCPMEKCKQLFRNIFSQETFGRWDNHQMGLTIRCHSKYSSISFGIVPKSFLMKQFVHNGNMVLTNASIGIVLDKGMCKGYYCNNLVNQMCISNKNDNKNDTSVSWSMAMADRKVFVFVNDILFFVKDLPAGCDEYLATLHSKNAVCQTVNIL